MTKTDLFRILIKVFGLYSIVITVFSVIPTIFGYPIYIEEALVWVLGSVFISATLFIALFVLLIFKADILIDWLGLSKGFDSDSFSAPYLNDKTIFKLAILIIGGITVLDSFPVFIDQSLTALQPQTGISENIDAGGFYWVSTALKLGMGLYLIFHFQQVQAFMMRGSAKKQESET